MHDTGLGEQEDQHRDYENHEAQELEAHQGQE